MPAGEDVDTRAERLLALGLDLACRVRDVEPAAAARAIAHLTPLELRDLALLLAAAVPVDRPMSELLGWWQPDVRVPVRRTVRPHGTAAAYRRHVWHGEEPCVACVLAYRGLERQRKAAERVS